MQTINKDVWVYRSRRVA